MVTLFEHQKRTVGAAMRSLTGPLKGMILGDPPGLGKTLVAFAVAALSWEPGEAFTYRCTSHAVAGGWPRLMPSLVR